MRTTRSILYTSAAVLSLVASGTAFAAPEGGVVSRGSATITTSGKKTDIRQSSDKVILDWRSFDIGSDEYTEFHQPSKNAIALNRINDTKASQINGKLTANGNIMLINPNGVVFGAGSQVDVGSLTATTADIDDDDFMAGKMDFKHAGHTAGAIVNNGNISVKDAGLVNFVAPQVENNGVIVAKLGKVQLAAADTFTLDMAGDGLLQVEVSADESQKIARNSGTISAEGGYVAVTAAKARGLIDSIVDNSGVIEASSMTTKGGKIILGAESGTTKNSGTIKANGKTGGGEILIGGDYQGVGDVKTTKNVQIAQSSVIEASATDTGDGGKVIVWADENTDMAGSVAATSGISSGKGGFIETSGRKLLRVDKDTDVRVGGLSGAGEWLIDPEDIVISDSGNDGNAGTSDIASSTINSTLNGGGNVTIATSGVMAGSGDITVSNANINKSTANNSATLRLEAHRNIVIQNSSITSTSGNALNVVLNADRDANESGAISINNSTVNTSGGYFIAGGGSGAVGGVNGILGDGDGSGADDVAAWGNSVYATGIFFDNTDVSTGAGDLILNGHGYNNSVANMLGLHLYNGSDLATTSGKVKIAGTGGNGTQTNYGIRVGATAKVSSATGSINLIGTGNGTVQWNDGMVVDGIVESTGSATISITGIKGGGTFSNDLLIRGTSSIGGASAAGAVTLNVDTVNLESAVSIRTSGDTIIKPRNAATTIGLGGGAGDLNLIDAELNTFNGTGKLIIGDALLGTGDIDLDSWDWSSKLFSGIELYGNDIDIGGMTMGAGNFMSYAKDNGVDYGDLNISANITRGVNGVSTFDLLADRNITNSNGADIIASDANSDGDSNAATSADSLNIILNADRNANNDGAISLTNATVSTLGGNFVAGGGTNPASTAAIADQNGGFQSGITISGSTVQTGAGNINLRGTGDNTGDDNYGVYIYNSSLTTGTTLGSGSISIYGTGGAGEDRNHGVYITQSSVLRSDYGDITINGTGGSNGLSTSGDNFGVWLRFHSQILSRGTGSNAANISITGVGGNGNLGNAGVVASDNNSLISSTDGDITIRGTGLRNVSHGSVVGSGSNGVALNYDADISSTGLAAGDAANIHITSIGDEMLLTGDTLTAQAGNITLVTDLINLTLDDLSSATGILTIKPYTASTSIGLGGGAGTLNLTDAELSKIMGTGKLIIGDALLGTGDIDLDSWDWSSKLFSGIELYGNDIDIGGMTMGSGNFMAYAKDNGVDYGDLNISANITRGVNGDTTLNLQADRNITNSNGADILASDANSDADGNPLTSPDRLNVILNADRNTNSDGAISLTDATITTLGGNFIAGGGSGTIGGVNGILGDGDGTGADDVAAWGNSTYKDGIALNNADISTGAGALVLSGHGYNNSAGLDQRGLSIYGGSWLETTSGAIFLTGTGGAGDDNNYGIMISSTGAGVTSATGTIEIEGTGGSSGAVGSTNNAGVVIYNGGTVSSTGTGGTASTIKIVATGATANGQGNGLSLDGGLVLTKDGDIDITGNTQYFGGLSVFNGGKIEADGSADITLTGTSSAGGSSIYTSTGSNSIGGATATGTVTLIGNTFSLASANIRTSGTTQVKGYTSSTSIGLGGGTGDLNLTDTELAVFNGTGKLIIGDALSGTGDIDLDSWDWSSKLFSGIELYGNDIDIGGMTMGSGNFMAYAKDNGVDYGDLNISANITRGVNGTATLDLRADRNIVNSNGADIIASDANSDGDSNAATSADSLNVILNADRNANNDGAISLTNATVTTLGGNFIAGGGSGTIGGVNGILGDGDGTGADDVAAWGNATYNQGVRFSTVNLSTGAGNVFIRGQGYSGGSLSNLNGFHQIGGKITTTSGDVSIIGYGGDSSGDGLTGVFLEWSNGIETNGGDIAIEGYSGTGSGNYNRGIHAIGTNTAILAKNGGSVHLTGFSDQTGSDAPDIRLQSGAVVEARGTGDILFDAGWIVASDSIIGGASNTGDIIFNIDTADFTGTSTILTAGDIYILPKNAASTIGIGGGAGVLSLDDGDLAAFNGTGKLIIGDAVFGTGDIHLDSWNFSGKSFDIELYGNDIDIGGMTMGAGNFMAYARDNGVDYGDLTVSAAITRGVAGTSALDLRADRNITLASAANITATTGAINVTIDSDYDSAGGGSIAYNATSIATNGGDITIDGPASLGADASWNAGGGVFTTNGALTLGARDLAIIADSVALNANITGNASSILTLKPYDNTRSIGLGGGAGDFNLTDAELSGLTVGHLIIGDAAAGAGDVTVQSWSLAGKSYDVELYGRDMDINGITMGAGDITMIAGNDVAIGSAIGNNGTGGDLYIDVGNDFTNTAGASAIAMGSGGRFLIYIDALSNITRGGMTTGNLFGRNYTDDDPSSINTSFGNRFVFDEAPTLTVAANDVTLGAYDGTYNSFSYTLTGLATGDTAGSSLGGAPSYSKTQLTPTTYRITPGTGTMTSTLGYLIAFQNGTLTMPIDPGTTPPPTTPPPTYTPPQINLPPSVEHQMQMPQILFSEGYQIVAGANTSFMGSNNGMLIQRKFDGFRVDTNEADAFRRMIMGGYLQIEQPVIDYYGLSSYESEEYKEF